MDDCLSKRGTWMKDQPITELLFNGRHYEIMYILKNPTIDCLNSKNFKIPILNI